MWGTATETLSGNSLIVFIYSRTKYYIWITKTKAECVKQ
jgi:hypothetical protein